MTAVKETEYFKKQVQSSLNNVIAPVVGAENWFPDVKYIKQTFDAQDRARHDLENGILLKLKHLRIKEIEEHTIKNCFENKSYNYLHAQKCAEFHRLNDYKINLMERFFADHMIKHNINYEMCWNNAQF